MIPIFRGVLQGTLGKIPRRFRIRECALRRNKKVEVSLGLTEDSGALGCVRLKKVVAFIVERKPRVNRTTVRRSGF